MRRVSYSPARQREMGRDRVIESERGREIVRSLIAPKWEMSMWEALGLCVSGFGFTSNDTNKGSYTYRRLSSHGDRRSLIGRDRLAITHTHAHNNGERADELSAFLKADRMIDSTVCLTASVPLPISLALLIATDPQSLRQRRRNGNWNYQQANASAKARSVDPCSQNFSDRGVDCLKRRELKIDHASGGGGGECSSSSRSVSCLIKQPQTIVLSRIH